MSEFDLNAIWLTLKLASFTTCILLVVATPLAWALAKMRSRFKVVIEAFVALPLVLPPTVLGFYFLIAFSPDAWFGQMWWQLTGSRLAFSFSGILLASLVYSLPFVVQPLQRAFEQFDHKMLEAAATMGASRIDRFFSIILPMTKGSFILATALGFAHTVGEFGVVLMIGGNIENETRVLSVALFEHVEALEYQKAHILAGGLLGCSMILLCVIYLFNFGVNQQRFDSMRVNKGVSQ